jgi:spermidine synthase
MVGGLGLGHTPAAVLADHRVATVDVVELQHLLVGWARAGLSLIFNLCGL